MITELMDGLPNQSMQQGAFDAAVAKYMADLPAWGAEANALAADVNEKQAMTTAKAASADASATDAVTQADRALAEANNAANSATDAAEQVPLATAQANNAALSATNAEASRIAASKLNLGSKAAAPAVDNQGAALLTGATYYDTTLNKWRVWNDTAWTDGLSAVAGVSSINNASGALALKTINGASLLSAGNLVFPTQSEVSIGIKRAPVTGGALASPNGYYAFMANAAYTLPDFTGSDTFGLASLSNSAAVPATFQTSDGWTLSPGLTANTLKAVAPTSSATPHGTWAGTLQTPPLLGAGDAIGTGAVVGSVQLSSSLGVILIYLASASYVCAFNPATGAVGALVQLGSNVSVEAHIYADSATSFVVGYAVSYAVAVRVGSVSDLTITLGTAVSGAPEYGRLIQLSNGLYIHTIPNSSCAIEAFSVSGTVVSKGNAISGGLSFGTVARVSATTFLLVGVSSSPPTNIQVMVGTVVGNTITFGTGTGMAGYPVSADANTVRFLREMAPGGPFIAGLQGYATGTTGIYHGITVSGTTPTIVAGISVAGGVASLPLPRTYIYPPASDTTQRILNYSSSQLLVTLNSGGVLALSITGTTLTAGAIFTVGGGLPRLVRDVLTGANCYVVTATTVSKITVAGTTISSVYQLASAPTVLASDTLNDKSVNYGGTWYAWTLPTMFCAVTADKWLGVSGGKLNFYGPIS